jgi:16S rRNA (cytosine1402-N4)-methyltransferase
MNTPQLHETVLRKEAVDALMIQSDGVYIDATFGRGGHSAAILERLGPEGRLHVIDRDPEAVAAAESLSREDARVHVTHGAFGELELVVERAGLAGKVFGILFDLGVSSPQLDQAQRGFSFLRDGPLDMRMDPTRGVSAAEWINTAKEKEIADVLYEFGEERHSRRMARRIVEERHVSPILNTARLAEIVKEANPSWEKDKHPATRAFQGIRIFINKEFDEISSGLEQALDALSVGGRLVVISFHSLEDRIVKKFIAVQTKGDNFPRGLPVSQDMLNPRLKAIGKATKPGKEEVVGNPRARSAVMRVAEKIA